MGPTEVDEFRLCLYRQIRPRIPTIIVGIPIPKPTPRAILSLLERSPLPPADVAEVVGA